MIEPIYANQKHKSIILSYLITTQEFAKEVSSVSRYNNYLDVVNIILEYHNGYGEGVKENNYWDWLMIIPINISVATNGFFAGIETKRNAAIVRAYKLVLDEILQDVVDKIDKLDPTNE
jgi:hypothetical protein